MATERRTSLKPIRILIAEDHLIARAGVQAIVNAHVEAGLSTDDMRQPFPEEMNRVLTTRLTNLHFAATEGAVGNICTEDFAFMCEEMGVKTNLDVDKLIEVARIAEEVVGRPLPGHVMRGGTLKGAKQRASQKAAA